LHILVMQGCFIATFPYIHQVYLHYIHPHQHTFSNFTLLQRLSKDFIVQLSYKNTKYIEHIYSLSPCLFIISLTHVLTSYQEQFYILFHQFLSMFIVQRGFSIVFYS
jgi:hypothetical protein